MLVQRGDIWSFASIYPVVITTNPIVGKNGRAVMGRGTALQAVQRHPSLPYDLARLLTAFGNHVYWFNQYRLFTFPVKHHWKEPADLDLIEVSAVELDITVTALGFDKVYMAKPGCGSGLLSWVDVEPRLNNLDDRFVVLDYDGG